MNTTAGIMDQILAKTSVLFFQRTSADITSLGKTLLSTQNSLPIHVYLSNRSLRIVKKVAELLLITQLLFDSGGLQKERSFTNVKNVAKPLIIVQTSLDTR